VNEVVVGLSAASLAIIRSDGRAAFQQLATNHFASPVQRKSGDKVDNVEGEQFGSLFEFFFHAEILGLGISEGNQFCISPHAVRSL
jgi:hypothetical protein